MKDKIATPNKADSDTDSHNLSDAIKKITFSDMASVASSADTQVTDASTHTVTDVLVIGAGLAGLATAYRLLQKNRDLKINVIEASGKDTHADLFMVTLYVDSVC